MELSKNPIWIEYCESTNAPSLSGFIDYTNRKYAGERSQELRHGSMMVMTK